MQIQIQEEERKAIGFFLEELCVRWQGQGEEKQGGFPSHLLWGVEPLHLKSLLLCCVLQKPGSRDCIAKSLPCLMANQLGRAGEPMWRWKRRDKARRWGKRGKGERRKGNQSPKIFFPPPLCAACCGGSRMRPCQGRREAEMRGRNVCAEGTAGSTAMVERGELLTERNGRRVREQHRRQKVFKKKKGKRAIRKKKGRE